MPKLWGTRKLTKKIVYEIPSWAKFDSKKTIKDKTIELVEKLPPRYKFYCELVHKELIKDKDFADTNIRRTREALQYLYEKGMLGHEDYTIINARKVKLYYRK